MAHAGGRPTVMTELVLQKLREAFAMDCTDEEACLFASISVGTLYNYQKEHPEFIEEKWQLKQNPFLKARKTIVENLDKTDTAKWYLEKKKSNEFATKTEQKHSGEIGVIELTEEQRKRIAQEFLLNDQPDRSTSN